MSAGSRIFSLSQTGIAIPKLWKPGRREREVGLEQPLELPQRLLVEHDVVEIRGRLTRLAQAVARRRALESPGRASCG